MLQGNLALRLFCLSGIFFLYGITLAAEENQIPSLLTQLTSPDEAERFKVLEKAKQEIELIKPQDIESALTDLRKKNVSTLIFMLMKNQSDLLYNINPPARMAAENSTGSFPNIAYYYARVRPEKGLSELCRLYKEQKGERLFICKGIGEIGTPDALKFLMTEAKAEKKSGHSIIPHLAGLESSEKVNQSGIDTSAILWLLEQNLDREEIILLSHLRTGFTQKELIDLYHLGERKGAYAVQQIFSNPGGNFESLSFIVDNLIENKQYSKALQLLMSDSVQRSADQRVKAYRDSVMKRIKNP